MVAFELARYLESTGKSGDAGRWYLTAAERFRRADWKTKAQESATRLGATSPAEIPAPSAKSEMQETSAEAQPAAVPEAQPAEAESETLQSPAISENTYARPTSHGGHGQRQRRGRRGRDAHRPPLGSDQPSAPRESRHTSSRSSAQATEETPAAPERYERGTREESPELSAPSLRGRYGDPGLSSRLTQMEMNFRRLLACTPTKLEEADRAPAGPGVWVLTDSDLTTYYYVEACQTLRVAIPNMARGGAARRGGESIKPKLAEHLGIAENRVAKYLADHCVVRWLQMDDDASYFAHFLIAVLHPVLND